LAAQAEPGGDDLALQGVEPVEEMGLHPDREQVLVQVGVGIDHLAHCVGVGPAVVAGPHEGAHVAVFALLRELVNGLGGRRCHRLRSASHCSSTRTSPSPCSAIPDKMARSTLCPTNGMCTTSSPSVTRWVVPPAAGTRLMV